MHHTDDHPETPPTDTEHPRTRRVAIRLMIVILGAALAIAVVLIPGNNWGFSAVLAAFWSCLAIVLFDCTFFGPRTNLLTIRILIALTIGAMIGNWFRLDADYAFDVAFGTPRPSKIENLDVRGIFYGRQSDQSIYFYFETDRETLDKLLAARLRRAPEKEAELIELREYLPWTRMFWLTTPPRTTMGRPTAARITGDLRMEWLRNRAHSPAVRLANRPCLRQI